jgi:hypothetical protein
VVGLPADKRISLSDLNNLAPLSRPENADLRIDDQFAVRLADGYDINEHWNTIGENLAETALRFKRIEFNNWYMVKLQDPGIINSKVRKDPKVTLVEQDERIDFPLETPDGEPFALEDLRKEAQGEGAGQGRQIWTKNGYWFNAMITAGEKLQTPIPADRPDHEYPMMSNPTPGEGVNIYVIDTGVMTNHVAFRTRGSDKKRARNFGDLQDSDPSPYCSGKETMVSNPTCFPWQN